jgi:hypothetical protein
MTKSSWYKLIDAFHEGVCFVNSYQKQHLPTLDDVAALLDTLSTDNMTIDRVYDHGKTNIALRKPDGNCSHIDRTGTVYQHGRFFIVDTWTRVVYYKP